jgi:hypothetical protein
MLVKAIDNYPAKRLLLVMPCYMSVGFAILGVLYSTIRIGNWVATVIAVVTISLVSADFVGAAALVHFATLSQSQHPRPCDSSFSPQLDMHSRALDACRWAWPSPLESSSSPSCFWAHRKRRRAGHVPVLGLADSDLLAETSPATS